MYQINSEVIAPFPFFPATRRRKTIVPKKTQVLDSVVVSDSHYTVKVARERRQITELLRLRYQVFDVELGNAPEDSIGIEEDEFDATSHHLIVVENKTNKIIGGYRLRTSESNGNGFYSSQEFRLNDLPPNILRQSVEIGRACIAAEHRNGKVLFLLWKGLAKYLKATKKRYFFGCCSIFSQDLRDGICAFNQLEKGGFLHEKFRISALKKNFTEDFGKSNEEIELPKLFKTYLRIGAKVCSPPVIDSEFGTIDFFVLCDSQNINEKYRKMFFA